MWLESQFEMILNATMAGYGKPDPAALQVIA